MNYVQVYRVSDLVRIDDGDDLLRRESDDLLGRCFFGLQQQLYRQDGSLLDFPKDMTAQVYSELLSAQGRTTIRIEEGYKAEFARFIAARARGFLRAENAFAAELVAFLRESDWTGPPPADREYVPGLGYAAEALEFCPGSQGV